MKSDRRGGGRFAGEVLVGRLIGLGGDEVDSRESLNFELVGNLLPETLIASCSTCRSGFLGRVVGLYAYPRSDGTVH